MLPFLPGKLPATQLEYLLKKYAPTDPRLILGGAVGEDAAVIDMDDRYLVAKTDPITFATDAIGWYAVHVNANDIACMGATPRWFLATLLLPEQTTTPALVESIFGQITDACATLGVSLAGGHTEITFGLERPIVVGQMLGEVEKAKLVRTGGALAGDDILLTKFVAVEGLSLAAREASDALKPILSQKKIEELKSLLHDPGISVVADAHIATATGGVHAMHDPTEGGLATGLHELAHAANVGLEIFADALPFHPDCGTVCAALGIDPLGLIASGSLVLAVAPEDSAGVIAALERAGISAARIGRATRAVERLLVRANGAREPLPSFARDEITKLFG